MPIILILGKIST